MKVNFSGILKIPKYARPIVGRSTYASITNITAASASILIYSKVNKKLIFKMNKGH